MTDAPERMWIANVTPDGAAWFKAFDKKPEFHGHHYSAYIPEATALAMVAAAQHERDKSKARIEALEARAYALAVAIMGGEDAPGYADSRPTEQLVEQIRKERLSGAGRIEALEAELLSATGRLCVTCGKLFPQSHPRNAAGEGCPEPDLCSIDMTTREAMLYWRQKAHDDRKALEAERDQLREALAGLQTAAFSRPIRHMPGAGGQTIEAGMKAALLTVSMWEMEQASAALTPR